RHGDLRGDRDEPPAPALRLRPGAGLRPSPHRADPLEEGWAARRRRLLPPARHRVVRARHGVKGADEITESTWCPAQVAAWAGLIALPWCQPGLVCCGKLRFRDLVQYAGSLSERVSATLNRV